MDKELLIRLIVNGLKDMFPKEYVMIGLFAAVELAVIVLQTMIIVTQTVCVVAELRQPQFVKKFKIQKVIDILLSLILILLAALIIRYLCMLEF